MSMIDQFDFLSVDLSKSIYRLISLGIYAGVAQTRGFLVQRRGRIGRWRTTKIWNGRPRSTFIQVIKKTKEKTDIIVGFKTFKNEPRNINIFVVKIFNDSLDLSNGCNSDMVTTCHGCK